jgi:hypothetical protein
MRKNSILLDIIGVGYVFAFIASTIGGNYLYGFISLCIGLGIIDYNRGGFDKE